MKKNLSFSIIGSSAIGMPTLAILIRHFRKIRHLFIIDPDAWQKEESYKHILSKRSQIGQNKVDAALEAIKLFSPKIKATAICEKAQDKEAQSAMRKSDIIISCVDNDTTRLDLQVFASRYKKTLLDLSAQIIGKERIGTARIFIPNKTPCIVCQGLNLSNVMTDSLEEAKRRTGYLKGTNFNPRSIALLDTQTACMGVSLLC
ncbi:MAG: hypothetical protein EOM23_00360, partial [Candidatus Moranbacteria bacterium]|nr:hypothetical protein [Candidatus Moranbacteria bacterium]